MADKKAKAKTGKSAVKAKAAARAAPKAKVKAKAAPAKTPETKVEVVDHKSIYRGFVDDILNAGRFELAAQYLDDVVTTHNPFPDQKPGREGFVTALRAFREAFPDLHAKATHLVAEGDLISGRFEITGTHRGPFMGIAATGNAIHYEEMAVVRLAGGRIVEHWSVADALAILQQLQASEKRW